MSNSNASRVPWKLSLMFVNYCLVQFRHFRNKGGGGAQFGGRSWWKEILIYCISYKRVVVSQDLQND